MITPYHLPEGEAHSIFQFLPWHASSRGDVSRFEGAREGSLQLFPQPDRPTAGAILMESDASIDSDGPDTLLSNARLKQLDPDWEPGTSLQWPSAMAWVTAEGKRVTHVNSRTFQGIVVPKPLTLDPYNIRVGDYAVCFCPLTRVFLRTMVYDESGHNLKTGLYTWGEVSQKTAEVMRIGSNPRVGNSVRNMITVVFSGSGHRSAATQDIINREADAAMIRICGTTSWMGQKGVYYV